MRDILDAEGICRIADSSGPLDGSSNGVDVARFSEAAVAGRGAEVRARFGIPAGARVIGFVGRLVREKGVVELMEAWRRSAPFTRTCTCLSSDRSNTATSCRRTSASH